MIKIDKRYCIAFSKAGIRQYAEFSEKDGKLYNPSFSASYTKTDEIPSVENLETIEEVLEVIKKFAYCNKAEILLINGQPVNYYNNDKAKNEATIIGDKFEKFKESEAISYFEKILEPIMKENKWFISRSHIGFPVLIEKNKEGEWDNIKRDGKDFDFNYLCYKFASNFKEIKLNLKSESNAPSVEGFMPFFNCISLDYFTDKGYYLEDL